MTAPGDHAVRRDPLKTAIGTGASGTGVQPWWLQRLTALALIPLSIWFVFLVAGLLGRAYPEVQATIGTPLNAMLLMLFVICVFWHGVLGLDTMIEDYVDTPVLNLSLRIATRFGASLVTLASVMALLAIWLRAHG